MVGQGILFIVHQSVAEQPGILGYETEDYIGILSEVIRTDAGISEPVLIVPDEKIILASKVKEQNTENVPMSYSFVFRNPV